MHVLAWLLSPVGKYVAAALAILTVAGAAYWKIEAAMRDRVEAEIHRESMERITDAIRRGDAVSSDLERVREPDAACRDCR